VQLENAQRKPQRTQLTTPTDWINHLATMRISSCCCTFLPSATVTTLELSGQHIELATPPAQTHAQLEKPLTLRRTTSLVSLFSLKESQLTLLETPFAPVIRGDLTPPPRTITYFFDLRLDFTSNYESAGTAIHRRSDATFFCVSPDDLITRRTISLPLLCTIPQRRHTWHITHRNLGTQ
jgi:hypothetical protein